ncbi:MAG TPA: DUF86 domain-containing protein [Thermomicrobiales bacterium]|nr:DUF86 domain-containing protein [Thermomicrobiales bacterium]
MQPKSPGLLWDMLDSARHIITWTEQLTFPEYEQDVLVRSAVERRFEVIGEEARGLSQHGPETASTLADLPRIIAFRTALAHGYDEIRQDRVWEIIRDYLPQLRSEIVTLLDSLDDLLD